MRVVAKVASAAILLAAFSATTHAQKIKPGLWVSFGGPSKPPVQGKFAKPLSQSPPREPNHTPAPIDCKMVRHPDPAFHSAMPVAKPPADVKFTMRVIPAPACKPTLPR